jgi:hypothetical protein
MSWVEFNQAIKAHQEIEEHRIRKEYEIARFEAILIINPTLDRKDKIKDGRDLTTHTISRGAENYINGIGSSD